MKKINLKVIFIVLAIIIIVGTVYYFRTKDESIENIDITDDYKQEQEENMAENSIKEEIKNNIKVYITGEVNNPGLYEIAENSRIADAIEAAGNLTESAYIDKINLAYVLEDGMKIYIPNKNDKNDIIDETITYVTKETGGQTSTSIDKDISTSNKTSTTEKSNTSSNTSTKNKEKININSATQTELETLPGIGSSTALKIINYRKENGNFKIIEDIKNVNGIGDSKYEKIKDLIKV